MKRYNNIIKFLPCLYASFIIGMVALEIGVILPYLMQELGLNYTVAGTILSLFAIGNLVASPLNAMLIAKLEHNKVILLFSSLIPLCFVAIVLLPSVYCLYGIVFLIGIGRGSISIFIYSAANKEEGKTLYIHWLSIVFAIGALAAPILTSLLMHLGMNWRQVICFFVVLTLFVPILLLSHKSIQHKQIVEQLEKPKSPSNSVYYKNVGFYVIGLIMFFYIGLENCVNGWFVQYFKDMNIMSNTYANILVSITWMFIIIGRLTSAYLSTKLQKQQLILINCCFAAIFFILLISTQQLEIITIAIVGLGFFCAGVYPTCISSIGPLVNGSASGMSITPQIVGILADDVGLVLAIVYLIFNMMCMMAFAFVNYFKNGCLKSE
jgi:fucose permease